MATAGSGDVLTGLVASFLGQNLLPLQAAILGVHIHGLAGEFCAKNLGSYSMTAFDLIEALPLAFEFLQAHKLSTQNQ